MLALKALWSLALLGFCVHGTLGFPEGTTEPAILDNLVTISEELGTSAESASPASSPAPLEECHHRRVPEVPRPSGSCYISETEAAKLSAQLAIWAKVLTIRTGDSEDEIEAAAPEEKYQLQSTSTDSEVTFCSEYRIELLEQDLASLVQRVWKMTTSLQDATDEEVDQFDQERALLIQRLSELQVYTMRSSALMTSITFKAQLDLFEANLDNILLFFPKSTSKIVRQILEPDTTTAELVAIAEQRPEAMSVAFPRLMAAKYAGNLRNFDSAFQLAQSLPSAEQQVEGYSALYAQMRNNSHLETWEVSKLAMQFFQTPPLSASASETVQAQLSQLSQELEPMKPYSSNRTQACSFKNVAYSTNLFTTGSGWPEHAAVHSTSSGNFGKLRLKPQNGSVTFEIHSGSSLLYSTSSGFEGSKRYVLEADEMFNVPAGAWKEWILMPVNGGKNFKILNAQYNEVMYVDTSTTSNGYKRVVLKKTGGTVSMATNADLWSLDCSAL